MPGEKHDREDIWQYIWRGSYNNVENGTEMLLSLLAELRLENPTSSTSFPKVFP